MSIPARLIEVSKKPVVVQAVKWCKSLDSHFGGMIDYSELIDGYTMEGTPVIYTLESGGGSGHHGTDGDWIIVGVKGERHFCKDAIFHATYSFINEDGSI